MAVQTTKKSTTKAQTVPTEENMKRGILFALLSIPVGIALWVGLWTFGFMAALVSFAIAWLAIFLYGLGAKASVSRKAAPYILGIIVAGVILAFLSGMASDAASVYAQDTEMSTWDAVFTADYWVFFADNLFYNGALWSSYFLDIVIAVVFGVLGCFSIVKDLFVSQDKSSKA